ncbi:MAG TPA: hypothetical protein VK390_06220 [Propionibacteriaceae bacterium]|nr:hypothetical protein [Propionibacteriaceae bacterium]
MTWGRVELRAASVVRSARVSADLATVDGDRDGVGDDEDADEPGQCDPDVVADGLLREQGS